MCSLYIETFISRYFMIKILESYASSEVIYLIFILFRFISESLYFKYFYHFRSKINHELKFIHPNFGVIISVSISWRSEFLEYSQIFGFQCFE